MLNAVDATERRAQSLRYPRDVLIGYLCKTRTLGDIRDSVLVPAFQQTSGPHCYRDNHSSDMLLAKRRRNTAISGACAMGV